MKPVSSYALLEDLGRARLSRTFFMRDFLHSEIAAWHGMCNAPDDPDAAIAVGRRLCSELLEPLQDTFGRIHIRSGYRSPAVNALGNQNGLNCASNEANFAAHIWDQPDGNGNHGASACIVIPWLVDHVEQGGDWTNLAWWIHDHLPYSQLTFFPKLFAFNINWREVPQRRIDSYAQPRGCLTKPGMPNHGGLHAEHYIGFPKGQHATVPTDVCSPSAPSQPRHRERDGPRIDAPTKESLPAASKVPTLKTVARVASESIADLAPSSRVIYRAVHTKTRWRKAHNHRSLEAAVHGKDGAGALFARKARVDYDTHGDPLFVLVWEVDASFAQLIKPDTNSPRGIRIVRMPIELALEYERQQGASILELNRLLERGLG